MNEYLPTIFSLIATAIIGVIAFFIKRSIFSRQDKVDEEIENIKSDIATKTDVADLRDDIEEIKKNYTPRETHVKDIDECRKDIKQISTDYITKEDFFREQNKVDRKLDRIMDILLEQTKG